ncbi:MAG: LCP family protein [Acidobacteria bacterium]|nr:LCP family protein [Acidobacteriota bacterium]
MQISSPNIVKASTNPPVLTDPVRYPQNASAPMRIKRAFMLLAMTLFVPGSAQVAAGNKKLGRRALTVTFVVWGLLIITLLLALFSRETLLSLVTNPILSIFVIIVLVLLAIGWAFLFVDTLRIIKPVLLAPRMRGIVAGALVALVVVTSGTLGVSAYLINSSRNAISSIFASHPDMQPSNGRYNFLIMGGDAGAGRYGRRPDSIMVVSVDAKTGKATTISIPRNFQPAIVPDSSPLHKYYPKGFVCPNDPTNSCILNAFYSDVATNHADAFPGAADPGAEGMMDAASGILGLDVQGYVLVDMAGFSQLIDALGGVSINAGGWVPLSGDDPTGTGNHLPPTGWIAPGEQKLDGNHALWYARSRQWATDYARSARQQCIMQAMVKQMDPATVLSKFDTIASAGAKVIESNISNTQIGSFLSLALKTKSQSVTKYTIGPPFFDRNFVASPDYGVIHNSVKDILAGTVDTHAADGSVSQAPADGGTPATGPQSTSAAPAAPATSAAPAAPAQPAAPAAPALSAKYLQQLAVAGDDATLEELIGNNGSCTPG